MYICNFDLLKLFYVSSVMTNTFTILESKIVDSFWFLNGRNSSFVCWWWTKPSKPTGEWTFVSRLSVLDDFGETKILRSFIYKV